MDKQDRIEKRIKRRENGKKHKKMSWSAQELIDAEEVYTEDFHGFPLRLLKLKNGGFKVVSSFFKGRSSAIPRRTASAALYQGRYLVYVLINFDDDRELMLSEEGWSYIRENDVSCPHPALRKEPIKLDI